MSILIIAEAGVNHNGDLSLAYKLADSAKYAGADIIKFQTFNVGAIVTKNANKAQYQLNNTSDESQKSMLEKLALSYDNFVRLKDYCEKIDIQFLSTPFDTDSIEFLNNLGVPFWKIPSGEITNFPYLLKIAKTGKPIVMSTGMCTMEDIENAINVLENNGCGDITLLHCNTEYPTPYCDVNLNAMKTMRNKFNLPVGYSDHTKGIEVPIAAASMGATIIEKHFTLDKNMEGPDHKASLEPHELKQMVTSIRNIELALGDGNKSVTPSEQKNIAIARKSIVAKRKIRKGELFSEENLTTKRPGNGISPMEWNNIIGQSAKKDFEEDELIV